MTAKCINKGVEMTIHRIELPTPFPVGPVNAYLIMCDEQRVLVDCGPKWPAARKALTDGLHAHGVSPEQLSGVVLTHGHIDHVGLASYFQMQNVPIYAHPKVQSWLEPNGLWDTYRADFFEHLYRTMGMPEAKVKRAVDTLFLLNQWNDRSVVDFPLPDYTTFPLMPQFQVVPVPGHAQAAIALWDEERGLFIGGDQLLPTISSNAFIEPELDAPRGREATRTPSLLQYRDNLSYLATLPMHEVFPGHGEPFRNPASLIYERLNDQVNRREQFRTLLQQREPLTAFELAVAYFPRHQDQLALIMSETIGYLDWLNADGEVFCASDERGIVRWRTGQ